MFDKFLVCLRVLISRSIKRKKQASAARFRSWDIRVMSPARFHCATALASWGGGGVLCHRALYGQLTLGTVAAITDWRGYRGAARAVSLPRCRAAAAAPPSAAPQCPPHASRSRATHLFKAKSTIPRPPTCRPISCSTLNLSTGCFSRSPW